MTHLIKNLIIVTFFCSLSFIAVGQCSTCEQNTDPVSEENLNRYKNNYYLLYRSDPNTTLQHSKSVDFSKQAIVEFYTKNFLVNAGRYSGVSVCFINVNSNAFPGQEHEKQIGLMLMPTTTSCKIDMSGYSVVNNSFNQDRNNNSMSSTPIPGNRQKYLTYTGNYKRQFHINSPKKYTRSSRFGINIFKLIHELFEDPTLGSLYKGLRFDFGSYNDNIACGQADPNQIALFLTPVKLDGSADYTVLKTFFYNKYKLLGDKDTFNHGELCPKNCPPEIN